MPWTEFCPAIEPYYPKVGDGCRFGGLERMLKMYLIANWFNLDNVVCEDALHVVETFRDFCQISLDRERMPDATTLLNFRHLLEQHNLGAAPFAKAGKFLLANWLKGSLSRLAQECLLMRVFIQRFLKLSFPRFFVFQRAGFMLPVFHIAER